MEPHGQGLEAANVVMQTPLLCAKCGAKLVAMGAGSGGLCPKCFLQEGLDQNSSFPQPGPPGHASLPAGGEALHSDSDQPNTPSDQAATPTSLRTGDRCESPTMHDGLTASIPPDAASRRTLGVESADAADAALGTRISHYKLLERVGEGGWGVVYVAEQTEPVRRRVALKIIKLGMDTKQVVARFEAERQALAMMDHPNIAKVLDGGSTDTGRPYFVMELVRGIRITDYCDQHKLSAPARLELFIQVCHAIQHAHQKGIIHRDIKPSNILVTLHDGVPVPKVIDFGIAKATEGRLTDATVYTQLNQFIGTPVYMSPEQAEMSGLDIDTRSDIYSLGVLLYELLTGRTPFSAKDLRSQGLEAMVKMIREKEPPRPSTRLATLKGEELTTTVERRATEAPKLISLLRGDLDWIVMKCLEKDRTRRYETANGLAHDIERHLKHEPVLARPPSRLYRLRKSIRRNRLAYAAAAAVGGTLVLGVAFSTWQAVRATRAEVLATERLQQSEAITKFMKGVLRSPDPARDGRKITVADALDTAASKLETELAGQPARRAQFQATLGETYFALGLYREAIMLQEEVLNYCRTSSGPDRPDTLAAMHNLANLYHAAGNDKALALAGEVVTRRRKVLGLEHPDTLASMLLLANLSASPIEAYNLRAQAVRVRRSVLGPEHPETIMAMNSLASSQRDLGRLDEALKLWDEALRFSRKVLGAEHPDTLTMMHNLAEGCAAAGHHEEALKLRAEVLSLRRKVLGSQHPDTIIAMQGLGKSHGACGHWEEAFGLLEEALASSGRIPGLGNSLTLSVMKDLDALMGLWTQRAQMGTNALFALRMAAVQLWLGKEADYAETCRQMLQWAADKEDPFIADRAAKIAHLRPATDPQLRQTALALARRAVELGQADPALVWFQKGLGMAEYRNGHYPEADQMLSTAASAGPAIVTTIANLYLAMSLFQQGKEAEASQLFTEVEGTMSPLPADKQWPLIYGDVNTLASWLTYREARALLTGTIDHLASAYASAGRLDEIPKLFEGELMRWNAQRPQMFTNKFFGMKLAALQVWFGKEADHTETCRQVLPWAANKDGEPDPADWAAKVANLRPSLDPELRQTALTLARRAVRLASTSDLLPWYQMGLGMAEYRNGHYPEADHILGTAALHGSGIAARTANFYRAMSLFRQGQEAEARQLFDETEARMKPLPAVTRWPVSAGDHNDLILWLAYKEARALLAPLQISSP